MSPVGRNLLLRILSAVVLLPVVALLVVLGGIPFALLVSLVAGLCAYEMTAMALKKESFPVRWAVILGAASLPLVFGLAGSDISGKYVLAILLGVVLLLWITGMLFPGDDLESVPGRVGLSLLTFVYTGGMLTPALFIRAEPGGVYWLVLIMAITFLNDTGAYAFGRMFGRRKLYPRVSPAKTWEGFAGGLIVGVVGALAVFFVSNKLHFESMEPLDIGLLSVVFLGFLLAAAASVGDLCESLLKRAFSVKDSGSIIPGHGGMLDRVDALLFTIPALWLWMILF